MTGDCRHWEDYVDDMKEAIIRSVVEKRIKKNIMMQ